MEAPSIHEANKHKKLGGRTMEIVRIGVTQPYDVLIGRGLLKEADKHLYPFVADKKVLIMTDDTIMKHGYLNQISEKLKTTVGAIHTISFQPGEEQKSMENVTRLVGHLADLNFSRHDVIIALGGGVIGDLAGFVASIYLRGIDFIQIPTTLLAAIDSSVGGKTAVDLPQGKNLVGAFYHPRLVLCDVDSFQTLEPHIFEDGCSELIKYGMIMNPRLLSELMDRTTPLQATDEELVEIVKECVEMKRKVVLEDEYDHGLRQLLNYGHTLGHAFEQCSQYQISHGRAVALGMSVFLQMADKVNQLDDHYREQFDALLHQYHLLAEKYDYTAEELSKAMINDKKRRNSTITIVLPIAFGKCDLFQYPIDEFLSWFNEEWQKYEVYS